MVFISSNGSNYGGLVTKKYKY